MKKEISLVTILLFIFITISSISCTSESDNYSLLGDKGILNLRTGSYSITHLFRPGEECYPLAHDCIILDPVVITPSKVTLLKQAASSGNSGTVGETFSSDAFSDLLDYLETGFKTKLQSGDYYISLNCENSNIINFKAGTSWPINDSNFEFAIEFAKQ